MPPFVCESILQLHLLFVNPYRGKTGARTQKMALNLIGKLDSLFNGVILNVTKECYYLVERKPQLCLFL